VGPPPKSIGAWFYFHPWAVKRDARFPLPQASLLISFGQQVTIDLLSISLSPSWGWESRRAAFSKYGVATTSRRLQVDHAEGLPESDTSDYETCGQRIDGGWRGPTCLTQAKRGGPTLTSVSCPSTDGAVSFGFNALNNLRPTAPICGTRCENILFSAELKTSVFLVGERAISIDAISTSGKHMSMPTSRVRDPMGAPSTRVIFVERPPLPPVVLCATTDVDCRRLSHKAGRR
jgi:hypothetical protein